MAWVLSVFSHMWIGYNVQVLQAIQTTFDTIIKAILDQWVNWLVNTKKPQNLCRD